MLTEKLMKIVARQNELTAKLVTGKLSDEERDELERLTQAIKAATTREQEVGKTTLTTMSMSEFQAFVEEQSTKMQADPDPAQIALLKRNIESVKAQGKADPEDVVAVEVMVELTSDERLRQVEAKLAEAELRIEELSTEDAEGDGDGDGNDDGDDDGDEDEGGSTDGDDTGKQDEGSVARMLATEAVDALITRFTTLKEKIESDNVTEEDLRKAWENQWELREMLEGAMAVMAKLDEAKALVELVIPGLEKLTKDDAEDDGDHKGDGDKDTDGDGDGDEDDNNVGKISWGNDLSPRSDGSVADFQMLRKASGAGRGVPGAFLTEADN